MVERSSGIPICSCALKEFPCFKAGLCTLFRAHHSLNLCMLVVLCGLSAESTYEIFNLYYNKLFRFIPADWSSPLGLKPTRQTSGEEESFRPGFVGPLFCQFLLPIRFCYLVVLCMHMMTLLSIGVKYSYCTPEISNKDVIIQYQNMLPVFLQCTWGE